MNLKQLGKQTMKQHIIAASILTFCFAASAIAQSPAAPAKDSAAAALQRRYPCRTKPEARQFDFWLGDWNVTPWSSTAADAPLLGTNKVSLMLESCALLEEWTGSRGGNGKSINFYDRNRNAWRQIWVADNGGSLDYTGHFVDKAMRFEGWTLDPRGNRVLQKLTFFSIAPDTVRQLFETSTDSGRTWTAGFDGRYVRRK